MTDPRTIAAMTVLLGWLLMLTFFVVLAVVYACMVRQGDAFDVTHDDDRADDEPLTAPGPAHPASRALARRVAPSGDERFAVAEVAEVVDFIPPPPSRLPAPAVPLDDSWADRIAEFADDIDPQLLERLGRNKRGVAW